MWAARYFNPRYWAARYWAKEGLTITDTPLVVAVDLTVVTSATMELYVAVEQAIDLSVATSKSFELKVL